MPSQTMPLTTLLENELKPGTAYLTIATVEQVISITTPLNPTYQYLVYPTTKEIRDCLRGEIYFGGVKVVMIIPASLNGSGLIKEVTKRGAGGDKSQDDDYKLPTDQFFRVPEDTYCFIICADLCGDISKSNKNKIKSLEGGCYKILDLSSHKIKFPLSKEVAIENDRCDTSKELVDNLVTKDGYSLWSSFSKTKFFYHFLIPGYRFTPIFARSGALSLIVWCQPFIKFIDGSNSLSHRNEVMGLFAYWVYCSVKYWNSYWGYKKDSKKRDYLIFIPSDRARAEWNNLTTRLGLTSAKTK